MTGPSKPLCSISVDVDSLDSVLRFYGEKPDQTSLCDPVYDSAVPKFLDLFDEYGIKATFFVVANDCLRGSSRDVMKEVIRRGHEIANHSLNHEFAFSLLSRPDREADIRRSTAMIKEACGDAPVGFRVPGYDIDEVTMDILDAEGYLYDSSVYKFPIYPIMRRMSYVKIGSIPKKDALRGLASEVFKAIAPPAKIYRPERGRFWKPGKGRNILEIPLSVMPFLGLPFNSTFLFMMGGGLFDLGFWLTNSCGMDLNYNFHSTDMLSAEADGVRVDHPGLNIDAPHKEAMFRRILEKISRNYEFRRLEALAREDRLYIKNGSGHGSS